MSRTGQSFDAMLHAVAGNIVFPIRENHEGCDRAEHGFCYHTEDRAPFEYDDVRRVLIDAWLRGEWEPELSDRQEPKATEIVERVLGHRKTVAA